MGKEVGGDWRLEGLPNPYLSCFQTGLVTLHGLGLDGLFNHGLEIGYNSSDVRCAFVLNFMDRVMKYPGMVRENVVFHFIHVDKFRDSLPTALC